jgi:hypothetical protein
VLLEVEEILVLVLVEVEEELEVLEVEVVNAPAGVAKLI